MSLGGSLPASLLAGPHLWEVGARLAGSRCAVTEAPHHQGEPGRAGPRRAAGRAALSRHASLPPTRKWSPVPGQAAA